MAARPGRLGGAIESVKTRTAAPGPHFSMTLLGGAPLAGFAPKRVLPPSGRVERGPSSPLGHDPSDLSTPAGHALDRRSRRLAETTAPVRRTSAPTSAIQCRADSLRLMCPAPHSTPPPVALPGRRARTGSAATRPDGRDIPVELVGRSGQAA